MNQAPPNTSNIAGIYPILYAFFDRDNHLDRAAMRRQIEAALRARAPGVAVLGLATEVNKLSQTEREQIIRWAIEDSGGTLPLVVTVSGSSVESQRDLAHYALAQGASSLILQPPALAAGAMPQPEAFYFDFFAAVMNGLDARVGIRTHRNIWASACPRKVSNVLPPSVRISVCSRGKGRRSCLRRR